MQSFNLGKFKKPKKDIMEDVIVKSTKQSSDQILRANSDEFSIENSDHEVIEEEYMSEESSGEFDEIEVEEEYSESDNTEEIMEFDFDESSRDLSYIDSDKSMKPSIGEEMSGMNEIS
jgi:hypothetical protein